MKRKEYKGQFDQFETPAGMWENIEKGLDEKKKKKRGFIWWRVAASVAIIIGAVAFFTQYGFDVEEPSTPPVAKNTIKGNTKPGNKTDTTQLVAKTVVDTNNQNGTIDIGSAVVEQPVIQLQPNLGWTQYDTTIPVGLASNMTTFTATAMDPFANTSYAFTTTNATAASPNLITQPSYTLNGATIQAPTYTSTRTPSKRGYAPDPIYGELQESDDNSKLLYRNVTEEENINRLNYRREDYIDYLDGDIESSIYYDEADPKPPAPKRIIPYEPLREANDLWMVEREAFNRSRYDAFTENAFLQVDEDPLSTFSIDVDGASYSDIRGMINRNELPNPDAVRIEEFVNYFPYDYEEPSGEHPFSIQSEVSACPWNPQHQLMKVAIKGKSIEKENLPTNNLVFLIDVSGSMNSPEKLEIIKKGFRLLVNELREEDHVSICVYASASGVVLTPTSGQNKDVILDALLKLSAGGSTAGGEGIELAYALAAEHFDKEGNNRIILATDGDFNVGISDDESLVKLIEEKRKSGVFLSVLGVGHDNYQSSKMEKLANNGNGNFSYIDNILEAKKIFVTEMGGTLLTIAKDVKIQMEFNPMLVSKYRLIGYENRMLENQDFSNDTIDAGELGAGHTVTAIYEIIPFGVEDTVTHNDGEELKYSKVNFDANGRYPNEIATMKFRYKEPNGTESKLIEKSIQLNLNGENSTSDDFKFAQAVVEFALILRQSQYMASANFESIIVNASKGLDNDPYGYRAEFLRLVEKTQLLWGELD